MEFQDQRAPSALRTYWLRSQGSILTWLIGLVLGILLIPPGQLDAQHCSFLNLLRLDGPSILCIHTDGTGTYIDQNSTTRTPLANYTLSGAQPVDFGRIATRAQVSKWLFVALLTTTSLWWHVWWASSYALAGWILWAVSTVEALVIVTLIVATRTTVNDFASVGPETSISYGTFFFASLIMISLFLGSAFHAFYPDDPEAIKLRFKSFPIYRLRAAETRAAETRATE
ncbi:hypothetical protein LRP88_07358 [Fusarium phalaenopsidis]